MANPTIRPHQSLRPYPDAALAAATRPYDWDDYAADFRSNENYLEQEARVRSELIKYPWPIDSVFEAGPGLGRITKIVYDLMPKARYSALDISAKALRVAEAAIPNFHFSQSLVGPLQLAHEATPSIHDLVIAVEVLMHIPPEEVSVAFSNLLSALNLERGLLITCDWTEPLPNPKAPIRVQNYRHDYEALFAKHLPEGATIERFKIGYQTLFVIELPQ